MTLFINFSFFFLLCVYFTEQTHILSHDHIKKINDIAKTWKAQFLSNDHIQKINDAAKTWKARQNFHPNTSIEFIQSLLGAKTIMKTGTINFKRRDRLYVKDEDIPKSFDARQQWKNCKTIGNIPNQGKCGSCWAFASTSAISDRLCIASKGEFNQLISVQELLSCCRTCGSGCNGGYPIRVWQYMSTSGLVTGGGFQSSEGCQPYKIKSCNRRSCAYKKSNYNFTCSKLCDGDETIDYELNHYKTRDAYFLRGTNIQKDLLAYGSVTAEFSVYDDFPSYSSGVYVKTEGDKSLGSHAVKLIGWGEENGVPYWLLVNSWGQRWGDRGTFKIRRGTNECGIENYMTAGSPLA